LENVASRLIPSNDILPNTFCVELLFRPLVPDNVTNWRVFDDDQQIINFLHLEGNFKDSIIEEDQDDQNMNVYVPNIVR
jgi:hypothetical protein